MELGGQEGEDEIRGAGEGKIIRSLSAVVTNLDQENLIRRAECNEF